MATEYSGRTFDLQPLRSREVSARFDGGMITSDAGGLLLREVEANTGLLAFSYWRRSLYSSWPELTKTLLRPIWERSTMSELET